MGCRTTSSGTRRPRAGRGHEFCQSNKCDGRSQALIDLELAQRRSNSCSGDASAALHTRAAARGRDPRRMSDALERLMAARFDGQIFTFTQPDGTSIQLRGWGDQYYAVFETLDGYTVTKNPATGYWEVAQLSSDENALEPAPAPGGPLDGAGAGLTRGLRIRREAALAHGRESALRVAGRRCEQRRQERRQEQRTHRALAAAGGPLLAP